MAFCRAPDWQGNFCTGMWHLSYRIDDERTLVFWGGGSREPSFADREWGVYLSKGQQRDFAGEQALLAGPIFAQQVTTCVIGSGTFLVTTEKQIDAVVDAARAILTGPPENRATA